MGFRVFLRGVGSRWNVYLGHEAVVISEAMDLGLGVQSAHPCNVHIAPHKADADVFGLGQVLKARYQVVPLPMMLTCRFSEVTQCVQPGC